MRLALFILLSMGLFGTVTAQNMAVDEAKWDLVWVDEFDGDAINQDHWSYEVDCWGGGNQERQCYTDSPENISIKDGSLNITALRQTMRGPAFPPRMRTTPERAEETKTQKYTSGRIRTKDKGDWRYGRFDIRAKLPTGQGTWPAIWMMPTDNAYGTWASSGEIDIMEAVNLGAKCADCDDGIENNVHGTLHFGDKWPNNNKSGDQVALTGSLDDWRVYSIVWSAGVITWYIDGQQYMRRTYEDWHTEALAAKGNILAPFDQRFHLILNLAIGGSWPESKNDKGVRRKDFPKTLEIDYVRVYQCASDPEEGLDCIGL